MTFGWRPMGIFAVFAMCMCASPEVGGFFGGHGKVELLFSAVPALCPRCAETSPWSSRLSQKPMTGSASCALQGKGNWL